MIPYWIQKKRFAKGSKSFEMGKRAFEKRANPTKTSE